ncbi:MAG: hypothetical protein NDI77_01045 [Geobacteraceae bacterium]|nr:hypothetical protein [Geobacteraceae bacterium]
MHPAARSGASRLGLLVACEADGAVGMVGAIVMVMECCHQGGKEKEADEQRCQALLHGSGSSGG